MHEPRRTLERLCIATLLAATLLVAKPAQGRAADSNPAIVGDFFRFRTFNSVTNKNRIVLGPGTKGWGIVTVASPAAKGGRAGSLVLEPLYLVLPGGRKMGVVLDHNASDLQMAGQSNNLPGYLGAIPVVGVGAAIGAFDYFHHGKDITVSKGTMFAVFPSNDPAVKKCRKPIKQ
jgi:hypothetical protein